MIIATQRPRLLSAGFPSDPDRSDWFTTQKFQRWIQLLISHWALLAQLSGFKGTDITQISLIHVRSAHQCGAMEPWESTIHRLAVLPAVDKPVSSFDAETAINVS